MVVATATPYCPARREAITALSIVKPLKRSLRHDGFKGDAASQVVPSAAGACGLRPSLHRACRSGQGSGPSGTARQGQWHSSSTQFSTMQEIHHA